MLNNASNHFDIGEIVITNHTPIDTCMIYAGLNKFKPACYFGIDFGEIIKRYNLKHELDYSAWYKNFAAAYSHYWEDPLGRMMAYDSPAVNRRSPNFDRMMDSIIPSSLPRQIIGNGVEVGFYLPSVELFRRSTKLPLYEGGLSVGKPRRINNQTYFQLVDIHNIPTKFHRLLDITKRQRGGFVWLSTFECDAISLKVDSELFLWTYQTQFDFSPVEPFTIASYEELSHSINCAHLARLSAMIGIAHRQPNNAGVFTNAAIRAVRAHRFHKLFSVIPDDCRITHTVDGIIFRLDNAYLDQVFEVAYKSNLLPIIPCDIVGMNWHREQTAFDVIFEARLKGKFKELDIWNNKAMAKGGIYA